jgi:hypothetical protein
MWRSQLAKELALYADDVPQRLKPDWLVELIGAAEASPFQNGLPIKTVYQLHFAHIVLVAKGFPFRESCVRWAFPSIPSAIVYWNLRLSGKSRTNVWPSVSYLTLASW